MVILGGCTSATFSDTPISLSLVGHRIIEGSLEVKLPTIWTDKKQRREESERREKQKREDQRRERVTEERRSRGAKR